MTTQPSSLPHTPPSAGPPPDTASHRPRLDRRARRHRAAAVGLGMGAVTMGVAETIHPRGGADGAGGLLLEFTRAPGTWTAWALLLMATALLQLPGVLAWRARRTSGPGAGLIGGGGLVLAAGLVALFSFGESHGEAVAIAGSAPVDPVLVEAYTRADAAVPLGVMVLLALVGVHLGWALFSVGLARAAVFPWPVGIAGVLGALAPFFLSGVWSLGETIGFWLLAGVLVWAAVRLYREATVPGPTSPATISADSSTSGNPPPGWAEPPTR